MWHEVRLRPGVVGLKQGGGWKSSEREDSSILVQKTGWMFSPLMNRNKDRGAYLLEDNWSNLKGFSLNVWRHVGHSVSMHLEQWALNREKPWGPGCRFVSIYGSYNSVFEMTQGKHLEWKRISVGPLKHTSILEGKKEKFTKEKVVNGSHASEWSNKRQVKAVISPTWQIDVTASRAPNVCRSPNVLGSAGKRRRGREDREALL